MAEVLEQERAALNAAKAVVTTQSLTIEKLEHRSRRPDLLGGRVELGRHDQVGRRGFGGRRAGVEAPRVWVAASVRRDSRPACLCMIGQPPREGKASGMNIEHGHPYGG